ncbi:hypothetical protein GCM10023192_79820 [Amycolatopsis samaneae]
MAGQAHFHPRRWLLALAGRIEEAGGVIIEDLRAQALGPRGRVRTSRGDLTAGDIVVATHYPYPIFDRGLCFARLDPVRDLVVAGESAGGTVPDGMYLDADTHHSVRGYAEAGRPMVLAGGEHYRVGATSEVERRYARLAAWAHRHARLGKVTHRWSAHDLSTVDDLPYVGRYLPGTRRLWVATGFGQWGMTGGTAAAHVLAGHLLGREHSAAALGRSNQRRRFRLWRVGTRWTVEVGSPRIGPILAGPTFRSRRSSQMRASMSAGVRWGVVRGRLGRSYRPASPSAFQRRTHLWAVAREMPISSATWAMGLPPRTRSTRSRLPWTVSRALEWDKKTSADVCGGCRR